MLGILHRRIFEIVDADDLAAAFLAGFDACGRDLAPAARGGAEIKKLAAASSSAAGTVGDGGWVFDLVAEVSQKPRGGIDAASSDMVGPSSSSRNLSTFAWIVALT